MKKYILLSVLSVFILAGCTSIFVNIDKENIGKVEKNINRNIIFVPAYAFDKNVDSKILLYEHDKSQVVEIFKSRKRYGGEMPMSFKNMAPNLLFNVTGIQDFDYYGPDEKFVLLLQVNDGNVLVVADYKDKSGTLDSEKYISLGSIIASKVRWSADGKKLIIDGGISDQRLQTIWTLDASTEKLQQVVEGNAVLIDIFPDGDILIAKQSTGLKGFSYYTELNKLNIDNGSSVFLASSQMPEHQAQGYNPPHFSDYSRCYISGSGNGILCQGAITNWFDFIDTRNSLEKEVSKLEWQGFGGSGINGPLYYYDFSATQQYRINASAYWGLPILYASPWYDNTDYFLTVSFYNPDSNHHDKFNLFVMNKDGEMKKVNFNQQEQSLLNILSSSWSGGGLKIFWVK